MHKGLEQDHARIKIHRAGVPKLKAADHLVCWLTIYQILKDTNCNKIVLSRKKYIIGMKNKISHNKFSNKLELYSENNFQLKNNLYNLIFSVH